MERYINQLINDIRKASRQLELDEFIQIQALNHIDFQEDDIPEMLHKHISEQSIELITGIDFLLLPPSERLSKKQKILLSKELERHLKNYNIQLEFPRNYPDHLKYRFIRKAWRWLASPDAQLTTHIEFCDFNVKNCPFRGYCHSCELFDFKYKHLN